MFNQINATLHFKKFESFFFCKLKRYIKLKGCCQGGKITFTSPCQRDSERPGQGVARFLLHFKVVDAVPAILVIQKARPHSQDPTHTSHRLEPGKQDGRHRAPV